MIRTHIRGLPTWTVLLLPVAFGLTLSGCKRQAEIDKREDRPINAQVENLGTSIKIIRKDNFPWHDVTFILDKRYEYKSDLVDQEEIVIPYDSFTGPDGEPYDLPKGQPFRLRIFAEEGRWPHWAAHN